MPDPSNPLALLLAAVVILGPLVGVLWREDAKTKRESYRDMKTVADQRYDEMRADRDFWRKRTDDYMSTQVQTLTTVREAVEVIRQTVEKLAAERQRGT